MKPEISLLCSQHPVTGPYTKQDKLNPHPCCFFKIYSTSFSLFKLKPCMHFPSPPCVPDALSTNSPLFDHWNNILLPVNIITLHITQFSPTVYHFLPLRGKYLFTTLFSNNPQFYISVRSHTSHPYQATGQNYSCV